MKKRLGSYVGIALMILMLLFITVLTFAQDVVTLNHTNYTTHYSKSKNYPVMVEWWITKAKVGCPTPLARKDKFAPDPLLKAETDLMDDYKGSGLDRGHNMPAAENQCQTQDVQDECFYFSNMTAQYHSLNAGDWKSLEVLERQLSVDNDSVHVWCGSLGEIKKIGKVSVPKTCWKVVYVVKNKEWYAYSFENVADKPSGLNSHKVTKEDIEKISGYKFR